MFSYLFALENDFIAVFTAEFVWSFLSLAILALSEKARFALSLLASSIVLIGPSSLRSF